MRGGGGGRGSGQDGHRGQQAKELDRRLISAIKKRDRKAALALLAQGAAPNAPDEAVKERSGRTAFLLAVEGVPGTGPVPEDTLLVRALLDRGADVNARNAQGMTALMNTAVDGYLETARLLLDRGAKVNLRDTGYDITILDRGKHVVRLGPWSALQYAQEFDHIEVMRLLLARGADVNVRQDSSGMTPLMYAASGGNTAQVRLLVEYEADQSVKDRWGLTAGARAAGYPEVLALLR